MYQNERKKSSGITKQERKRRMHQAYEILLSVARRKTNDASVSELGNPERTRRDTPD